MSEPMEGRPVRDTAEQMQETLKAVEAVMKRVDRLLDRAEKGQLSMVMRGPFGLTFTATPEVGK